MTVRKPKRAAVRKAAAPKAAAATVPSRTDPRVKKIFVYSEGTFVLHTASEVHKIVIKTPAFDVAGWIDLSKMAPGGDTVYTEIRVSFANRSNVLYHGASGRDRNLVSSTVVQRPSRFSPKRLIAASSRARFNACIAGSMRSRTTPRTDRPPRKTRSPKSLSSVSRRRCSLWARAVTSASLSLGATSAI
jgi:hypothetical protein